MGFLINPYDPCVANKERKEKQMTITWHVDDLKISHVDANEVEKMIKYLKSIYGQKITEKRGKVHDYLRMTIDYTKRCEVQVSMIPYIKTIIEEFPEEISNVASSPASDRLFQVRDKEEAVPLNKEKNTVFKHCVAQLLFLLLWPHRDIETAVVFLTTRVKMPDEDDWGKVKHVLKYLQGTQNLKLTLSIDKVGIMKRYVDVSYAVHHD